LPSRLNKLDELRSHRTRTGEQTIRDSGKLAQIGLNLMDLGRVVGAGFGVQFLQQNLDLLLGRVQLAGRSTSGRTICSGGFGLMAPDLWLIAHCSGLR
jgi:hypothetical protein